MRGRCGIIMAVALMAALAGCSGAPGPATPAPEPSTPVTPPGAASATAAPDPTPAYIQPGDSWIEVSLDRQLVILHAGQTVVGEFAASSGVSEAPTPPGLYRVQMKEKGPIENVPGVWVADIVIFHWGKGIGIHSMPMDADGNVLDATLGTASSGGCVRVGESGRVFDFAEVGMRVWVH